MALLETKSCSVFYVIMVLTTKSQISHFFIGGNSKGKILSRLSECK